MFCNEPFNEKVDIWALGCVAYEMLNGVHPFPAENKGQMRRIHGTGSEYEKLGADRDAVLADLIDKMLVVNVSLHFMWFQYAVLISDCSSPMRGSLLRSS